MGNTFGKPVKCERDSSLLPPPPPLVDPRASGPGDVCRPSTNEQLKTNPGTMDEFHKKCKDVFPTPLEGARIVINKTVSQHLRISHYLTMSAIQPSGYRFGSTYVGNSPSPILEPSSLVMGDIDPTGTMNAQGYYNFTDALKLKWLAQIANNKYQGLQMSFDYKQPFFTLTGCVLNPSIVSEQGMGVIQYLHAVTPRVSLGGEFMYQKSPAIPEGYVTAITASARYSDEVNTISGVYGQASSSLHLHRRLNADLQISLEIERSQQQFSAGLAYQYDIPKANFIMRGMIDNNWTVSGMIEKTLVPMPCMIAFCGSINHIKNQFRLGCQIGFEL